MCARFTMNCSAPAHYRSTFSSNAWIRGSKGKGSLINIAIVGCGPAGLASAIILQRLGHQITLIERFGAPRPLGSGIILQPTGLRVLGELGIDKGILSRGKRIDRIVGRSAPSLRRVLNVDYAALGADYFGLAVHRAALFDVLLAEVTARGIELITDKEIVGMRRSTSDACLLDRDDQLLGPFDLVVDASGARSPLHRYAEHVTQQQQLEYGVIWGTFEWPGGAFESDRLEQRYVAAHTMIGVLPVGTNRHVQQDQVAFFWSLRTDDYVRWQNEGLAVWKAKVRKIWPETESILAQIVSADQMVMAQYGHHTMRTPLGDRIVFVGDAAHATSPQLGQGANMALLDAWALGHALGHSADLASALRRYAATRRWHVRGFQAASLSLTPFYQSDSRTLAWVRDRMFDTVARLPIGRRIVAGLISGMLGDPLGKIGLGPKIDSAIKRD